jgi:predicted  nucleic acid-binding Zn-ribbon protein
VFTINIAGLTDDDTVDSFYEVLVNETPRVFFERTRVAMAGVWKTDGTFSSAVNALHKALTKAPVNNIHAQQALDDINELKKFFMRSTVAHVRKNKKALSTVLAESSIVNDWTGHVVDDEEQEEEEQEKEESSTLIIKRLLQEKHEMHDHIASLRSKIAQLENDILGFRNSENGMDHPIEP